MIASRYFSTISLPLLPSFRFTSQGSGLSSFHVALLCGRAACAAARYKRKPLFHISVEAVGLPLEKYKERKRRALSLPSIVSFRKFLRFYRRPLCSVATGGGAGAEAARAARAVRQFPDYICSGTRRNDTNDNISRQWRSTGGSIKDTLEFTHFLAWFE